MKAFGDWFPGFQRAEFCMRHSLNSSSRDFIWLFFDYMSLAGINFLSPVFCSCCHTWISRCVVHLPHASIFTVPGRTLGTSPVLRKTWYMGDSESPSCYQVICAGEMRDLSLAPHSLSWGPSAYCEPGNCHHPQEDCEHQRASRKGWSWMWTACQHASTFHHAKKPNAAPWCLGRKTPSHLAGLQGLLSSQQPRPSKQAGPPHPSQWNGVGTWVSLLGRRCAHRSWVGTWLSQCSMLWANAMFFWTQCPQL